MACIISRRVDNLSLEDGRNGQLQVDFGADPHRRGCIYSKRCREFCAFLEGLEKYCAKKVQPFFAWLRHLRVVFPEQINNGGLRFAEEEATARGWQDEFSLNLSHVSRAVSSMRFQLEEMQRNGAGDFAALAARLQAAGDAWAERVASLRAEAFVLTDASTAAAAAG